MHVDADKTLAWEGTFHLSSSFCDLCPEQTIIRRPGHLPLQKPTRGACIAGLKSSCGNGALDVVTTPIPCCFPWISARHGNRTARGRGQRERGSIVFSFKSKQRNPRLFVGMRPVQRADIARVHVSRRFVNRVANTDTHLSPKPKGLIR